ncbi:MAG TPA: NADH-quinone oxidoreductase subunit C, partial [Vicinamibacteria bacterium]|nr:NADH-quinone oxidoreductase subunit C [Vicinamibacteria bacterium]
MASATETTAPPSGVASPTVRLLREALGDDLLRAEEFRGDLALTVARRSWAKAATLLKSHPELDYALFLDLCAVDYLDAETRPERYEIVLHLYSVSKKHHVRLKT